MCNFYTKQPEVEHFDKIKVKEMNIDVFRYNSDIDHSNSIILVDREYECDGLEDEYRRNKVMHETRIPDGTYKIEFRTEGGFHQRYTNKFGSWHKGMLWIKDVPGFEYILIHIGNSDDDTSGCLVVGYAGRNNHNWIAESTTAYKAFYPKVRNALQRGEQVSITFKTLDNYEN
jgi:hypothetical protein